MKKQLGVRQQAWVDALKAHPERQTIQMLGRGTPRKYKACCLGEACLVKARLTKKKAPFKWGFICSQQNIAIIQGKDREFFDLRGSAAQELAVLNDNGSSWTDIASMIEEDPYNYFYSEK